MFNEYQIEHMKYLESISPDKRCWCGWYELNKCPRCPKDRTCEEKLAVRCPECHNDPGWNGNTKIIHTIGCGHS
jgi:hypothetical protein